MGLDLCFNLPELFPVHEVYLSTKGIFLHKIWKGATSLHITHFEYLLTNLNVEWTLFQVEVRLTLHYTI